MTPFARAVDSILSKLIRDAMEQLDGIPEHDLNEWRPALKLEDVNTFYALATHLVGAGEYWILHAAGGQPLKRDRPSEFIATGTPGQLVARYELWLSNTRAMLEDWTDADLARVFERGGDDPIRWTAAECILHALEHTGVHVGHLQIQRQIWNAEHGITRA